MVTRRSAGFGLSLPSLPKNRIGREVLVVLLVKLAILTLAAIFVFGPNQRPHIDAAKVLAHFVDAPHAQAVAGGATAAKE